MTSHAGVFRWPSVSAYAVSKAAVVKLTENIAQEVRRNGVSVFSFDPGLQPIGLTETALAGTPAAGSVEAAVAEWLVRELAEGRGAEPDDAARWLVALAAGRGDALSGRHLSVHDDLASLVARLDEVKQEDLYTLRLRTGSRHDPLPHSVLNGREATPGAGLSAGAGRDEEWMPARTSADGTRREH